MKRITAGVAAALVVLTLSAGAALATTRPPRSPQRVVIVLTPYLRWSDITTQTPALHALASDGAVANMNTKNRNRAAAFPSTVEQAALTISSGAWAAMERGGPSAYSVDEPYNEGTAAEAFARLTGSAPSGADVVFLGLPKVLRQSAAANTVDVVPGTMGGAIVEAGGVTAAIGNGDTGRRSPEMSRSRPAALVAMDYQGLVRHGDVSTGTLHDDVTEPYGVATDVELFMAEYADVERSIGDTAGPALVVLDPGDLTRVAGIKSVTDPTQSEAQHAKAVATVDAILGLVRDSLPSDALLLVVTPVNEEAIGTVSGLAPIIAYGAGYTGYLESSSTQRTGLVTNLDVAATVLSFLDVERPVQVLGNPFVADGADAPLSERLERLSTADVAAVSVDTAKPAVVNGFIGITLIVLITSTVLLLRSSRWNPVTGQRAAAVFSVALLGILSVPPATLLMFALDAAPRNTGIAVVELAGLTTILWIGALLAKRFAPMRVPVAALSLLMTSVLLVDQWLGASWSFTSFLGYSPLVAARYYGIGNEGAALLFGSSLVGAAFLMDQWPDSAATELFRRWGVPLLGAVIVGTCAAPTLGANVGVIAWGVIGFAVAWALMNGYKVTWKLALAALVVIIGAVAAFSIADLSAGDSQTHLGRAWQSADQGGVRALWSIVERKAETNLRVLTHTNWSFILVGVLAFLGFMRWRPQGDFAAALDDNPHFSAAMAACLIGGLAAYFTEDSGIVIPALIMVYLAGGILYLMLDRIRTAEHLEHPADQVAVSAR